MYRKEVWLINAIVFVIIFLAFCCADVERETTIKQVPHRRADINVIEGRNEVLDSVAIQKGKVLIAYSDCYTCHAIDKTAKGPPFTNIAKRYPANSGYIELLANKIILGGRGAWGNVVMEPHPDVSLEDARNMARYILSLDVAR